VALRNKMSLLGGTYRSKSIPTHKHLRTFLIGFERESVPQRDCSKRPLRAASAYPYFWQIFGKMVFRGRFRNRESDKTPVFTVSGLGGLEPPTSPLSVLRSLVPQLAVILAI